MSLSSFVSTQVTEVVFWGEYLFVGQGSRLRIFEPKKNDGGTRPHKHHALLSYSVFQTRNVHLIKPGYSDAETDENLGQFVVQLCVTGGCVLRLLNFNFASPATLKPASPIIKFQDWILDVRWLPYKQDTLVILTAQNYIVVWNNVSLRYSGIIVGNHMNELMIFSGTVFSEVLVWNPETACVSHRLKGHTGVIFDIDYNSTLRKLCTSSDDRTVRIWKHQFDELNGESNLSAWKNSSFLLMCRLYGHEARVWKVISTRQWVISSGEDSMLCFWSCDEQSKSGELCRKVFAHNGCSIRSVSANTHGTLLATGGENGGVKVWNIKETLSETHCDIIKINRENEAERSTEELLHDYPRSVKIMDDSNFFIISNNGVFFHYCLSDKNLKRCYKDEKWNSYSIVDITQGTSKLLVAIGDLNGEISLLQIKMNSSQTSRTCPEFAYLGHWKVESTKILALKWLTTSSLLTCGGSQGRMDLFTVEVNDDGTINKALRNVFQLPPSRQRWFTAAAIIHNEFQRFLFCGSRNGSLFLYGIEERVEIDVCKDGKSPVQIFNRIHGMHGVTCINLDGRDQDFILTSGRDGFIRKFVFRDSLLQEMNKIRVSGCSKWIAGLFSANGLFVYGFHADKFVLWSEEHEISVLEISCGGGHRCWDFSLFGNDKVLFAYVKSKEIIICSARLKDHMPITIMPGSHIKKICNVHYLFQLDKLIYFATASEDTTVKISTVRIDKFQDSIEEHPEDIATLKSHISSVRSMASCPLKSTENLSSTSSEYNKLMVTCGGRAQMVLWILTISDRSKVLVEQVTSHMLHSGKNRKMYKKPWLKMDHTEDPETRYMDAAVWATNDSKCYMIAVCCSDSYLRIFGLNIENRMVKILVENAHHGHCLLKVKSFRLFDKFSIIVTTATDGKAILWDVTSLERAFVQETVKQRVKMMTSISSDDGVDDDDDDDDDDVDFDEAASEENSKKLLRIIHELNLHQSGVTAIDIRLLVDAGEVSNVANVTIATGGDDTALNIVVLKFSAELSIEELSQASIRTAHSSQITDVLFVDDGHLVTVSGDQRLSTWRLQNQAKDLLVLENCVVSSVGDISSAAILNEKNNRILIAVAGIGLEIFDIDLTEES